MQFAQKNFTIIATMPHGLNNKRINKIKYVILQHYDNSKMPEISQIAVHFKPIPHGFDLYTFISEDGLLLGT